MLICQDAAVGKHEAIRSTSRTQLSRHDCDCLEDGISYVEDR